MTLRDIRRLMQLLAKASPEQQQRILSQMTPMDLLTIDADFQGWADDGQLPPAAEGWRVWLMMAGARLWKDAGRRRMDPPAGERAQAASNRARGSDDRGSAQDHGRRGERHPVGRRTQPAAGEMGAEPGQAEVARRKRGAAVFRRQCRRAARARASRRLVRCRSSTCSWPERSRSLRGLRRRLRPWRVHATSSQALRPANGMERRTRSPPTAWRGGAISRQSRGWSFMSAPRTSTQRFALAPGNSGCSADRS